MRARLIGAAAEEARLARAKDNGALPVPTAELLGEVRAYLTRFLVLPSDAVADLLALWVLAPAPVHRTLGW